MKIDYEKIFSITYIITMTDVERKNVWKICVMINFTTLIVTRTLEDKS